MKLREKPACVAPGVPLEAGVVTIRFERRIISTTSLLKRRSIEC